LAYKPPYFLLYVNDLLSSSYVDLMDSEQFGWYMKLLMRSWQSDIPCYLPNDFEVLRSVLRIGRRTKELSQFDCRFPLVYERFSVTDDKKLIFHPRLVEQYNSLLEKHDKQVSGGQATASGKAKQAANLEGKQTLSQISDLKSQVKTKASARSARSADSDVRHTPTKLFIEKCCKFRKVPFLWSAAEAKQLKDFLQSAPGLSLEAICDLVRNRFNSREPPGDRPRKWLSNLGKYATVTNGQGTYAQRHQESTVEATNAVVSGYQSVDSDGVGESGAAVGSTHDERTIEGIRRNIG
jgi:uncharacterized protein YdaU (DUF1376 family)